MARKKRYSIRFYKEVFLSLLAVISVGLLLYEYIATPPVWQIRQINHFDFAVAVLFLFDFLLEFVHAKDKTMYLRKNWYLLLASIPLVDSWTEILRALRLLSLVRLVRAGEHVTYVARMKKN